VDALAVAPEKCDEEYIPEPRLALGRGNGSVELWDTSLWTLHQCTPGHERRSIRSLVWVPSAAAPKKARLFSAGLHREVTEWDPRTLVAILSVTSGGGPIWSLTSRGTSLYGACEDGSVRFFDVKDSEDIMMSGRVQAFKSRVLSVATYQEDYLFVGGSQSQLAKWSIRTNTCEATMNLEKAGPSETLVWAMVNVANNYIATGDSLGLVLLWDPEACILAHRFAHHQADVLSLATDDWGSILMTGGMDGRLATFMASDRGRFVFRRADEIHSHDIKAIAVLPEAGYITASGNAAGELALYEVFRADANEYREKRLFPQGNMMRGGCVVLPGLSPVLQTASVAPSSRVMLCQRDTKLELWYLQHPKASKAVGGNPLPEGQHVLRISLDSGKQGKHIAASAIAPDGQHIAASDDTGTKVFSVQISELQVQRLQSLPEELDAVAARALLFCGDSTLAIAPRATKELTILSLSSGKITGRFKKNKGPVSILASEGEWVAAADLSGVVQVYNLDKMEHHSRVPLGTDDVGASSVVTAMCIDGGRQRLIVALSSRKFVIFDIEARILCENIPSVIPYPRNLIPTFNRVCGLVAPPEGKGKLLIWGHGFLNSLNVQFEWPEGYRPPKKQRTDDELTKGAGYLDKIFWRGYPEMSHIMALHCLEESQWGNQLLKDCKIPRAGVALSKADDPRAMVVTLEVAPSSITDSLPPKFERKKFQSAA